MAQRSHHPPQPQGPTTTQSEHFEDVETQYIPSLRGGAVSRRRLDDDERVPTALWWFAGGRGRPPRAQDLRERRARSNQRQVLRNHRPNTPLQDIEEDRRSRASGRSVSVDAPPRRSRSFPLAVSAPARPDVTQSYLAAAPARAREAQRNDGRDTRNSTTIRRTQSSRIPQPTRAATLSSSAPESTPQRQRVTTRPPRAPAPPPPASYNNRNRQRRRSHSNPQPAPQSVNNSRPSSAPSSSVESNFTGRGRTLGGSSASSSARAGRSQSARHGGVERRGDASTAFGYPFNRPPSLRAPPAAAVSQSLPTASSSTYSLPVDGGSRYAAAQRADEGNVQREATDARHRAIESWLENSVAGSVKSGSSRRSRSVGNSRAPSAVSSAAMFRGSSYREPVTGEGSGRVDKGKKADRKGERGEEFGTEVDSHAFFGGGKFAAHMKTVPIEEAQAKREAEKAAWKAKHQDYLEEHGKEKKKKGLLKKMFGKK